MARRPATPVRAALLGLVALTVLAGLAGCSGADQPQAAPARTTGTPAAAPTAYDQYVALGDSYTAAPLVPPTDFSTVCLRSGVNYPALVAKAMPGTALTDVSCSGATTADTRTPQQGQGGDTVPPQFDALKRSTDLVTIGLGGNDDGLFVRLVVGCVQAAAEDPTGSPCRAGTDPTQLDRTFADIRGNVAQVVRGVRARAPHARILVVGYPQIVPASGSCKGLPLAAGDYRFGHAVNKRLDDALRAAARRTRAGYVDVWAATAGHDICAKDPWINGRVTSAGRALAYHPLAVEQRHVADLVLAAIR